MVSYQTKEYTDTELLSILHPDVRNWFTTKFETFCPPQRLGLMNIHSRINTLVTAPTGSGKTLTAFLSVLNELVDSAKKGILEDKIYAVYLSPLKALNNDIARNLLSPLKEIEEIAGEKLGIRVGVRTGDTPQSERAKMLRKPPHILITTPESLAIMLSTKKFVEHLKDVQWCIVDEIHSLAENKRGVHMSLSIERLNYHSAGMCRIGLSATVAPIEEIAKFLVGPSRKVSIVDAQFVKEYDLQVVSPVNNLIDTPHFVMQNGVYAMLHKYIQNHQTTLVFTNTRAGTERVVDNLKLRHPKDYVGNIGAHHGSMGKQMRFDIEHRLKHGELKACVSSTSLELGIDIGSIDLVLCMSSPKSVARFLQRVGRAGHSLHETVKGRLMVMDRDDLIECSVLLKNAVEKKIDKIHIPTLCLDVLAQQIAGMALEQIWDERELYDTIRKSYCFADLPWKKYSEILDYLAGRFVDLEQRYIFAKIWREDGKVGKRGRMGRVIYMTNVGTIPDQSFITVKVGEHVIGKLDEGFLEKMRHGDVFVLGGEMYQFKFSRGMTAQVRATPTRPPTVPAWVSEMLPLSFDLANSIGKFRRLLGDRFRLGKSKKEIIQFIHEYTYVDEKAANAIYLYFKEQYDYCQIIPHDKLMLVEQWNDEDNDRIIFHTLYGRRVNDCLSRAIAFIISRKTRRDVEVGINDNGFYLSGAGSVQLGNILRLLKSEKLDLLMSAAIEKSEVYRRRFRHCAERALMILKNYKGRRKSVGRSQVNSMILMSALKRISTNFTLLEEAKREVLEDLMDIESTRKIIEQLENGTIKIEHRKTRLPSPFAFKIAFQGKMDVLKMEDKYDFLRRMHEYVLARIGNPEVAEIPRPEDVPELYDRVWQEQQLKEELETQDEKTKLMEDARIAMQRLKLPRDYLENMYKFINGEKRGYRRDFLEWVTCTFNGAVPTCISDDLAKFVQDNKALLV
jgi:ATP-dependent Lhr-like helicase